MKPGANTFIFHPSAFILALLAVGLAVANGRVYVSLQNGGIVCFDKAE